MPIADYVAGMLSKLSLGDSLEIVLTDEEASKLTALIEENKKTATKMPQDIWTNGLAEAVSVNLQNLALRK